MAQKHYAMGHVMPKRIKVNPTTRRGENTCSDIVADNNAYGDVGALTIADLHQIIDSLHTHFMDNGADGGLLGMMSNWMAELDKAYDINTL